MSTSTTLGVIASANERALSAVTFASITSPTLSDPFPHTPLVAGSAGAGAVFGSGDNTVVFSGTGAPQSQSYRLALQAPSSFGGTVVVEFTLTSLPASQFHGDFSVSINNPYRASGSGVQVFIGGDDNFNDFGYRAFINVIGPSVTGTNQEFSSSTLANISSNSTVRLEITDASCVLKVNGAVAQTHNSFTGLFNIPPDTPGDPTTSGLSFVDMTSGGLRFDSVSGTNHSKACVLEGISISCTGGVFTVLPSPP